MTAAKTIYIKASRTRGISIKNTSADVVQRAVNQWIEREGEIISDDSLLVEYDEHYSSVLRYVTLLMDYIESQFNKTTRIVIPNDLDTDIDVCEILDINIGRALKRLKELADRG